MNLLPIIEFSHIIILIVIQVFTYELFSLWFIKLLSNFKELLFLLKNIYHIDIYQSLEKSNEIRIHYKNE